MLLWDLVDVFGVGILCCILFSIDSCLFVSCNRSIASFGEEKANLSALVYLFTCNYVISIWRSFLFLLALGMGYVILLWHSLGLLLIILQGFFALCKVLSLSDFCWRGRKSLRLPYV